MKKTKLAIFASGSGSNAMNLIQYFKSHSTIEVELILSNNKNAPIIAKAEAENVKLIVNKLSVKFKVFMSWCLNGELIFLNDRMLL